MGAFVRKDEKEKERRRGRLVEISSEIFSYLARYFLNLDWVKAKEVGRS